MRLQEQAISGNVKNRPSNDEVDAKTNMIIRFDILELEVGQPPGWWRPSGRFDEN